MKAELNVDEKKAGIFKSEMALWVGILTTLVFFTVGKNWLMDLSNPLKYGFIFIWLFVVMLWLSFGVVRHADCLAIILGEPYGTLILTLAVISIEVIMIAAVMLTGENNPTLARDTMFSVLMIVLNGMLGLTLLMGGLRHHEQEYSLSGASAYLGVLFPLAVLGLVVPRFTTSAPGGQVSILMSFYLVIMSAGLYAVFLLIQTMRHSHFFKQPADSKVADIDAAGMYRQLRHRTHQCLERGGPPDYIHFLVNQPVIEAVMIGIEGQTSISFVRTGIAIEKK